MPRLQCACPTYAQPAMPHTRATQPMPAQPKLTPCDPCLQKSKTKSPAEEEEKICAVQAVKKAEKEGEDDVIQCYYLRRTQHNYDWCRGKPGTPYEGDRICAAPACKRAGGHGKGAVQSEAPPVQQPRGGGGGRTSSTDGGSGEGGAAARCGSTKRAAPAASPAPAAASSSSDAPAPERKKKKRKGARSCPAPRQASLTARPTVALGVHRIPAPSPDQERRVL